MSKKFQRRIHFPSHARRPLKFEGLEQRKMMAADLDYSLLSLEDHGRLQELVEETRLAAPTTRAANPRELVMQLKSESISEAFANSLENVVQLGRSIAADLVMVTVDNSEFARRLTTVFEASPLVEFVEANELLEANAVQPNDPSFEFLHGLHNVGRVGLADADIDAPHAWEINRGSESMVVAVIDSGTDYTHPDLRENIWVNAGEIAGNGVDDDGNGFVDDIHGYDFFADDADPMDENGHGTHVAGTIAASGDNGQGVIGVAPNVKIMPLRFLGPDGSGSTADAIRALDYAVSQDVKISNNSWGGGPPTWAMSLTLARAGARGHVFVAAAGNDGSDNDLQPQYPSSYSHANVISVAATDSADQLATFSNYGKASVDIAAPGVSILSTLPGGGYGFSRGTSMAAPHVAGVVALVMSEYPDWSVSQVIDRVLNSGDPLPQLDGVVATGARVNAARALGFNSSVNLDDGALTISLCQFGDEGRASRIGSKIQVDLNGITEAILKTSGVDQLVLLGGDGDDRFTNDTDLDSTMLGRAGNDYLVGGESIDWIFGEQGNDHIDGRGGGDLLFGEEGNDYLLGGSGGDLIDGGDGVDGIRAGNGNDEVYAGSGDDKVFGGAGNDQIHGGEGRDELYGELGDDLLRGDADNDWLHAGLGADQLFGDGGHDQLYGFAGANRLEGGAGNDAVYGGDGNDVLVGGDGDDKLEGHGGRDELFGDAGDDTLRGGEGRDDLYGGAGNDGLFGNRGDDWLHGEEGNDYVDGGLDNDQVYGGPGADRLFGDDGHDSLHGGDGNDVVNAGRGNDRVYGGDGDDSLNGGSGDDRIYGRRGADTLLGGDGNDLLDGGAGMDLLKGERGDDYLLGGDDDDQLIGGRGLDTMDGGNGSDLIDGHTEKYWRRRGYGRVVKR